MVTQTNLNKYQDQWGRYHDKKTDGVNPSSNNGWIYTAYARKVGLPLDFDILYTCANMCFVETPVCHFNRSPDKVEPPISRDEILGLEYLGVQTTPYNDMWNFSPYVIPDFSLVELLKQLWQFRPTLKPMLPKDKKVLKIFYIRHRNYLWENKLDQMYRFAFSVPLQDRDFIIRCRDVFKWYKPSHIYYRVVAKLDSLFGASGIKYLKYDRSYEAMVEEFPEDHPLRIR